ncbi:hypothetical protein PR048_011672 [Dryococelus australis]|uniref:Uncharacterized protein n=1 Tax=Dryococelus australis TaxID=614101 RepID=A0ABQ9HMR6_9NEOP|nr:hypothetical protein PR048_011672 [Dryococelus australis]
MGDREVLSIFQKLYEHIYNLCNYWDLQNNRGNQSRRITNKEGLFHIS